VVAHDCSRGLRPRPAMMGPGSLSGVSLGGVAMPETCSTPTGLRLAPIEATFAKPWGPVCLIGASACPRAPSRAPPSHRRGPPQDGLTVKP
jgi:hypothetical protein